MLFVDGEWIDVVCDGRDGMMSEGLDYDFELRCLSAVVSWLAGWLRHGIL